MLNILVCLLVILSLITVGLTAGWVASVRRLYRLRFLMRRGYKIRYSEYDECWQYLAPDETDMWRDANDSVKRQRMLDESKRLNVPEAPAMAEPCMEAGRWRDG